MTRQEFIDGIEQDYADCVDLIRAKNADYGADSDPFRNFRMSEALGIPVEKAILVRMSDKLARIATFCEKGTLAVADEKVDDTLKDLANYAVILNQFIKHGTRF